MISHFPPPPPNGSDEIFHPIFPSRERANCKSACPSASAHETNARSRTSRALVCSQFSFSQIKSLWAWTSVDSRPPSEQNAKILSWPRPTAVRVCVLVCVCVCASGSWEEKRTQKIFLLERFVRKRSELRWVEVQRLLRFRNRSKRFKINKKVIIFPSRGGKIRKSAKDHKVWKF